MECSYAGKEIRDLSFVFCRGPAVPATQAAFTVPDRIKSMDSKGFLRVQRQNRDSNGSIETKSLLQKLMVQGRFRLEKPLKIAILFARKLINRDSVCRNPSERDFVSRNPLESVLSLFCLPLYSAADGDQRSTEGSPCVFSKERSIILS